MTMTSKRDDFGVDLSAAVALFRSLGDVKRLAIVQELAQGERRVVDLTRVLGVAQSTVSAHLACLAECGLVTSRPLGRQSFYQLAWPAQSALLTVLAAAEQLLQDTGNAVVLCPTADGGGSPGIVLASSATDPAGATAVGTEAEPVHGSQAASVTEAAGTAGMGTAAEAVHAVSAAGPAGVRP